MFQKQDTLKITDFEAIRLRVASPDTIRSWSFGEVSKPETINYRTQKPEKGGLFAEEIFGPSKDWECYCGKYKKIRFKGIVCDKCGVEVTHSIVRRERMGHIELAAPVTHIWFLRGVPSKIGTVLDLSVQALEKVIYFASFIVSEVNEEAREQTIEQVKQEYKSKQKMIEGEFKRDMDRLAAKFGDDEKKIKTEAKHLEEIRDKKVAELEEDFTIVDKELKELKPLKIISEETFHDWSLKYGHIFEAGIGAEAVHDLLKRINVEATMKTIEEEMEGAPAAKRDRLMRRLKLLKSLFVNNLQPSWMILEALPVIPPDLRPMVPLSCATFKDFNPPRCCALLRPAFYHLAQLLARIYGVFALKRSGCGGRVRLIGFAQSRRRCDRYWRMPASQQLRRQSHPRAHHRWRRMHSR